MKTVANWLMGFGSGFAFCQNVHGEHPYFGCGVMAGTMLAVFVHDLRAVLLNRRLAPPPPLAYLGGPACSLCGERRARYLFMDLRFCEQCAAKEREAANDGMGR